MTAAEYYTKSANRPSQLRLDKDSMEFIKKDLQSHHYKYVE